MPEALPQTPANPSGWLYRIARRLLPPIETMHGVERTLAIIDPIVTAYCAPLLAIGLVWLTLATNWGALGQNLPALAIWFACGVVFSRLTFFVITPLGADLPASLVGSLSNTIDWTAAWLFGPVALWIPLIRGVGALIIERPRMRARPPNERWEKTRSQMLGFVQATFGGLITLTIYQAIGGTIPIAGLTPTAALPGLIAVLCNGLIRLLLLLPYFVYMGRAPDLGLTGSRKQLSSYVLFVSFGMSLPLVLESFAVLLAGLYAQAGTFAAGFLIAGLLATSAIAHQLSRTVETSQERSRELAALEQLAKALMAAPPDGSKLADVLKAYVPGMFRFASIEIRLWTGDVLLSHRHAFDTELPPETLWGWLRANPLPRTFNENAVLPWDNQPTRSPLLVAPIHEVDPDDDSGLEQTVIGGLYLTRQFLEGSTIDTLLPAAQSLIGQIQSALYNVTSHRKALELQRVDQELAFGSQIQRSFLPLTVPEPPGWQIDAVLEPARQTSGDFYDFFALPSGKIGFVVADVADKGVGAALYMALVRTLIRTYAVEVEQPSQLLTSVNRRILADARADLFVTVFYGTLDPTTGTLIYGNAGHNPAFLFSRCPDGHTGEVRQRLCKTGIPLGMFDDVQWTQESVQIAPGELLTVYTDGLTEAQNPTETQFGEGRLINAVAADLTRSAERIRIDTLASVRAFIDGAAQFDDITLVVLAHNGE